MISFVRWCSKIPSIIACFGVPIQTTIVFAKIKHRCRGRSIFMALFRKVSRVTELLQREGNSVQFQDVAATLRDVLDDTSVYFVSRKGKLLGHALAEGFESTPFDAEWLDTGHMPEELATSLLKVGAISTGPEAERI